MSWLKAFAFKQVMVSFAKWKLGMHEPHRIIWVALVRVARQHPDEKVSQWILQAHKRLSRWPLV